MLTITHPFWSAIFDQPIKNLKFNFDTEQPLWVYIKRTLTGMLAVDGHNLIDCVWFEEQVKKPPKKVDS